MTNKILFPILFSALLVLIVGSIALADSGKGASAASDLQANEQRNVTSNQQQMETAVGLPQLNGSLERANIKKRLETFSDGNKISYIYLTSFGKVMAFYTVKGKITSGNKRLTSTERLVSCEGGGYNNDCIMESPELDGTYGSSAPYIYFWTTDGTYVQWSGEYMLADQPLKLTTTPELVRSIK